MSSADDGHHHHSQAHFVTADLVPIPEHECFTGHGELHVASLSSLSGSGGHLSLLSSSLGPIGHDEDDEDVEVAAAAAAASFPHPCSRSLFESGGGGGGGGDQRGAGISNVFDGGLGGDGGSIRESLSRASHHDLAFEWSMLRQECTEFQWSNDLQLAAELGKTLLERNKELESSLKHQQAIIEDQAQEIEYLSKQNLALREVNDSRVKVYEQLEENISELEATNKKLVEEGKEDKGKIKSLCANVSRLENRCDDLQHCLDELRASSPLAAASLAVASRIFGNGGCSNGKSKRFVNDDDDEGDEEEEEEEDYDSPDGAANGPKSLGVLETARSAAQRRRINRTPFLAPPTSWEARQKRQTPKFELDLDEEELQQHQHHHLHHHASAGSSSPTETGSRTSPTSSASSSSARRAASKASSSGYSSSSIASELHLSAGESDPEFTPPPKLSEEESASHSISSTSSSSLSASCKPGDSTVVNVSTERHEEALDRVRSLEGTVERLQAENAALRVEPEWSSGLRSVQEEVSNVDVVRMGKLCRRCLGPMEEFAPGDLLSQAALQMSENLMAESRRISVDEPAGGGGVPNFCLNSIAEQPEEEARASGSYGAATDDSESGPVSLQDELRMCNEYIWVRRKSSMMPLLHDRSKGGVFARTTSAAAATQTEEGSTPMMKAKTSMTMSMTVPNYKDIFREIFTVLARAREDSVTTAAAAAVGSGVT